MPHEPESEAASQAQPPRASFVRVFSSAGRSAVCTACGAGIHHASMGYEVHFGTGPVSQPLLFHVNCFLTWDRQHRAPSEVARNAS